MGTERGGVAGNGGNGGKGFADGGREGAVARSKQTLARQKGRGGPVAPWAGAVTCLGRLGLSKLGHVTRSLSSANWRNYLKKEQIGESVFFF